MEARTEAATANDIADEEDLNISNLLVTKSERAPASEPAHPLREEKFGPEVMKAAGLAVLGGLGIMAGIMLARMIHRRTMPSE